MARRGHAARRRTRATLELDLGDVKPSLAGPKRPQDRVLLEDMKDNFHANLEGLIANRTAKKTEVVRMDAEGGDQPQAEHLAAQAEVEDPHRTTRTANSPTARS